MKKEVKVVIGANYGDEGKGLVSYCLAKDAIEHGNKVLTVLYNGGVQRGHTAAGKVYHCLGTGTAVGSDTFYHNRFMVDPIALWLTNEKPIIDPQCRVVLPCDVLNNRAKESAAGKKRHGSCGMGIFEASKRSANIIHAIYVKDLLEPFSLFEKLLSINEIYGDSEDALYNTHHFMLAAAYIVSQCEIVTLDKIINRYQTIIYEGGQGLLLDQANIDDFPHLTPSSVGSRNIHGDIESMTDCADIFYVSRTYMTRHGNGPMENECNKADINPNIIDKTNQPNEWQGSLRFGFLNTKSLYSRIKKDIQEYRCNIKPHLVYTQMNYTDNKLALGYNKLADIELPCFVESIYGSNEKDYMKKIM